MDTIKTFLDTPSKFFGHRLRAILESRGVAFDQFARDLQISRATLYNWFEREQPPPSRRHQTELVRLLGEPADYVLHGATETSKIRHLKSGENRAHALKRDPDIVDTVAPRLPERPEKRAPSTRVDCEYYVRRLLEAAEASENPNAFPVIHDRLRRLFPIEEWEDSR